MLLLSVTAKSQQKFATSDFKQMKWLEGSWKGYAGSTLFYEGWRVVNDSVMVNFAIEIKNSDTIIRESSALLLRNGRITLGQIPSQWTASRITPNELVLKNDTLSYSNVIIWLHTKDDHWFTILENPKSTIYYDMTRDVALDKKLDDWIRQRRKR